MILLAKEERFKLALILIEVGEIKAVTKNLHLISEAERKELEELLKKAKE